MVVVMTSPDRMQASSPSHSARRTKSPRMQVSLHDMTDLDNHRFVAPALLEPPREPRYRPGSREGCLALARPATSVMGQTLGQGTASVLEGDSAEWLPQHHSGELGGSLPLAARSLPFESSAESMPLGNGLSGLGGSAPSPYSAPITLELPPEIRPVEVSREDMMYNYSLRTQAARPPRAVASPRPTRNATLFATLDGDCGGAPPGSAPLASRHRRGCSRSPAAPADRLASSAHPAHPQHDEPPPGLPGPGPYGGGGQRATTHPPGRNAFRGAMLAGPQAKPNRVAPLGVGAAELGSLGGGGCGLGGCGLSEDAAGRPLRPNQLLGEVGRERRRSATI